MRIRTMAGIAVAGVAAAVTVAGGVAYATADESETTLRIVTEQEQPAQQEGECPEEGGGTGAAPSPEGTGL